MASPTNVATAPLSEWSGRDCLLWLADHTDAPNFFRFRAEDWDGEVQRFADYEGVDPAEWEANALEELRSAIAPHFAKGCAVIREGGSH